MTATLSAPKASPSLYELTLDSQEIDGQLAIALDKAGSEDPEQQAEAEALITSLLETANTNQKLLARKANGICAVREMLLGKANYLRKSAAERIAKAEAEERAAQRLEDYLLKCLQVLHPGQTKFELPEYTISSRSSEAVELSEGLDAPKLTPTYQRCKVEIAFADGAAAAAPEFLSTIQEMALAINGTVVFKDPEISPDKTAIKAAIKAGTPVPGAQLVKRRNWSIK